MQPSLKVQQPTCYYQKEEQEYKQRVGNSKRGPRLSSPTFLSLRFQEIHFCTKSPSDVAKINKIASEEGYEGLLELVYKKRKQQERIYFVNSKAAELFENQQRINRKFCFNFVILHKTLYLERLSHEVSTAVICPALRTMEWLPEVNRLLELWRKCPGSISGSGAGSFCRVAEASCILRSEPVFLNDYGAQKSIPRNEFLQPM